METYVVKPFVASVSGFKYTANIYTANGTNIGHAFAYTQWGFQRLIRRVIKKYESEKACLAPFKVDSEGNRSER